MSEARVTSGELAPEARTVRQDDLSALNSWAYIAVGVVAGGGAGGNSCALVREEEGGRGAVAATRDVRPREAQRPQIVNAKARNFFRSEDQHFGDALTLILSCAPHLCTSRLARYLLYSWFATRPGTCNGCGSPLNTQRRVCTSETPNSSGTLATAYLAPRNGFVARACDDEALEWE